MIVSLLTRIKEELTKYSENGGAMKPTDAYNLISGIYDVNYRNMSDKEAYIGYILSNTANEYSNCSYAKFTNMSGKPLLFLMMGADNSYPYGSALVVPVDYIENTDYKIENGTGSSSYQGTRSYTMTTPKKHKIKVYYTNYAQSSMSSLGLYWYMHDRTISLSTSTNMFLGRTGATVKNRVAILADYLIFGER